MELDYLRIENINRIIDYNEDLEKKYLTVEKEEFINFMKEARQLVYEYLMCKTPIELVELNRGKK